MNELTINVIHPVLGEIIVKVQKAYGKYQHPTFIIFIGDNFLGYLIKDLKWQFFMTPENDNIKAEGFAVAIGEHIEKNFNIIEDNSHEELNSEESNQ